MMAAMTDAAVRIRPARADDYDTFARLFPELDVPDRTPERGRWEADFVPASWIAEDAEGAKGVVYVNVLEDTGYVRMIMVDPAARRRGIGRALMKTAEARFREAGCTSWCLNTYPHNAKAIALYESLGLRRVHEMIVMQLPWRALEGVAPAPGVRVRAPAPEEDARIEAATRILKGQLAALRPRQGRFPFVMEDEATAEVLGAAVMDPAFPGASPFRVMRPELTATLLLGMRPLARPELDHLNLPTEAQPEVAEALRALGAKEHMRVQHMRGALTNDG